MGDWALVHFYEKDEDELYHLAAQTHVAVSFADPLATADFNALGTLRDEKALPILERFVVGPKTTPTRAAAEKAKSEKTPVPKAPADPAAWLTGNSRPGNIFAGVGDYRLIMQTSTGAPIYTADPVSGDTSLATVPAGPKST